MSKNADKVQKSMSKRRNGSNFALELAGAKIFVFTSIKQKQTKQLK